MNSLENQFHAEMQNVYRVAKKDIGYNATRFLQLISDKGGVKAEHSTKRTLPISGRDT